MKQSVKQNKKQVVLDMTLNCILVYDSKTERFFRTPGPRTKYLSAFFSFKKLTKVMIKKKV